MQFAGSPEIQTDWMILPANEVIEVIKYGTLYASLHFAVDCHSVLVRDCDLISFDDRFDHSLVSQHVRLQI